MDDAAQREAQYFEGPRACFRMRRMLVLLAVCYMFEQMDVGTFAYVAPVLIEGWGISVSQVAQVNSLSFVGMFVGAIVGGWLGDKIGRKKTLIASVVIFSVGSIASGLAASFSFLILARFVVGVGVTAMVIVAMVFICEVAPSSGRGSYVSLTTALGVLGVPLGALFARWVIPMNPEGWRWVFVLGGGAITLVPLCFVWLVESPRWLVAKGRTAEANKILLELTGHSVASSEHRVVEEKSSIRETLRVMFCKEYSRRTVVLVFIMNGVIVGAYLLAGFYPTILQKYAGFELTLVLSIMAISWWGIPFGDLLASRVSDWRGRKVPLAVFTIINGVTYIVCGLWAIPMVIIAAVFLSRIFGGGSTSMVYTYVAESYPTRIRSNAVGMIMGLSRLVSAASVLVVPAVLAEHGWLGIHLLNAAVVTIPAVIVLVWGEKTSKRTLESLNRTDDAIWSGCAREDMEG